MKFDENEMKLNLNERLREVRENQKARFYKEMIHCLLFFTQNSYASLKVVHYPYRMVEFLTLYLYRVSSTNFLSDMIK